MQARVPDNAPPAAPMLLGSFQTGAGNQRTLDCDVVGASTVRLHCLLYAISDSILCYPPYISMKTVSTFCSTILYR